MKERKADGAERDLHGDNVSDEGGGERYQSSPLGGGRGKCAEVAVERSEEHFCEPSEVLQNESIGSHVW